MQKYDLLMFDMDGTFIDSARFHVKAYHRFFNQQDIPVTMQKTIQGMGFTIEDMFRTIGIPKDRTSEIYEKLALFYQSGADDLIRELPLISGAKEVFENLRRQGYRMCVVTNSLQPVADRILTLHGLKEYFAVVEGATQQESDKEKRCKQVLQEYCGMGKPALYIGDAGRDIEIANLMGCDSCLATTDISWVSDPQKVIDEFKPTYTIHRFDELNTIL